MWRLTTKIQLFYTAYLKFMLPLVKQLGSTKRQSRVGIVSTTIHFPVNFALMLLKPTRKQIKTKPMNRILCPTQNFCNYLQRESIHVCSESHNRTRLGFNFCYNPSLGKWVCIGDAQFVQFPANKSTGVEFFKSELWVFMHFPPY